MFVHVSFQKTTRFFAFSDAPERMLSADGRCRGKRHVFEFFAFYAHQTQTTEVKPSYHLVDYTKSSAALSILFSHLMRFFDEKAADFFKTAFRRPLFCHCILLNISASICIVKTVCHQLLIAKNIINTFCRQYMSPRGIRFPLRRIPNKYRINPSDIHNLKKHHRAPGGSTVQDSYLIVSNLMRLLLPEQPFVCPPVMTMTSPGTARPVSFAARSA